MNLRSKKILIISPERWGINFLSKHHYAIHLARRGNQVFFVNPPVERRSIEIVDGPVENLFLVQPGFTIPGLNRLANFFPTLFYWLNAQRLRRIIDAVGHIDIVWSFDPFRYQNLRLRENTFSIFHPVDFFQNTKLDVATAKTADIIFSPAHPILNRYEAINVPKHFINHGVSESFLNVKPVSKLNTKIRCGYVGNLLNFGIHHDNLLQIISENTDVEFNFIGPIKDSNLGSFKDYQNLIEKLKQYKNVLLHGAIPSDKIAEQINAYDVFLICYSPEQMGDMVSNNHKLLEYLSTGKIVVSSYISTYEKVANGLFEMAVDSRELPAMFRKVVSNIASYNTSTLQEKRIAFATSNSYENQVDAIERLVEQQAKNNREKT